MIPVPDGYADSIGAALQELASNPQEYWELIEAVRKKKPMSEIVRELGGAVAEASSDLEVLIPAIDNVRDALRTGTSTSEYRIFSGVNKVLTVIAILSPVIEAVVAVFEARMGGDPSFGASLAVSTVSIGLKSLLSERYTQARTALKRAAVEAPFEITPTVRIQR